MIVAKAINYCSCKSVLPGGVSVCSYQAAALPPPLPLAQVTCTAMGWSQLWCRQLWLLQNDKWETACCSSGFMRNFVSENSYWLCVSGWKLHLGTSCKWQLWNRMSVPQQAGLGLVTLKYGFYLRMNWRKGWRVPLTNWHKTKLGRNKFQMNIPRRSIQLYWHSVFSNWTGRNVRKASARTQDKKYPIRRECWKLLCSVHLNPDASKVKLLWKVLTLLRCLREIYISAGKGESSAHSDCHAARWRLEFRLWSNSSL